MSSEPDLILYFLQASRAIRVAWLLTELNLPFKSIFYDRENNKAPSSFKGDSGNPLGKSPALRDGDNLITESGAITEFLIQKYEPSQDHLGGQDTVKRSKIQTYIHSAEGTFMVHALAITYSRWFATDSMKSSGDLGELENGMAVNVQKDLDWLDGELAEGQGRFLVGDTVTAADTMVLFSVQFIFAKGLYGNVEKSKWTNINRWISHCEATNTYMSAVKQTGFSM